MLQETNFDATIIVDGGDTSWQLFPAELRTFLDNCAGQLQLRGRSGLDDEIAEISTTLLHAAPTVLPPERLRKHLLFLEELNLFFKGFLYERKNES